MSKTYALEEDPARNSRLASSKGNSTSFSILSFKLRDSHCSASPSVHFLSCIIAIIAELFRPVSCLMFSSIVVRLSNDVFQIQLLHDEMTWILHFMYA